MDLSKRTRRQALLQLLGLVDILHDKGVQVTPAPQLELDDVCGLVLDDLGDLDVRDGYICQSAASPWFPNAIIAPSPLDRCATKASGRDQTGRVG